MQNFDHPRQDRENDNRENNQCKVLADKGEVSEEVPPIDKGRDPGDSSADVITQKAPIGHPSDSRDEGREGPNNWHESREYDRLHAILFVKVMRAVEIFLFQETDIFLRKDFRSYKRTDGVIDRIACYSSH